MYDYKPCHLKLHSSYSFIFSFFFLFFFFFHFLLFCFRTLTARDVLFHLLFGKITSFTWRGCLAASLLWVQKTRPRSLPRKRRKAKNEKMVRNLGLSAFFKLILATKRRRFEWNTVRTWKVNMWVVASKDKNLSNIIWYARTTRQVIYLFCEFCRILRVGLLLRQECISRRELRPGRYQGIQ